jgi:prepilin-type N-terminal cleavage/methylation domain-containing protein
MFISGFLAWFKRKGNACVSGGFTLIEVLVVIAIVSVLAGIMLGYARSSTQQILLTRLVAQTEAIIANARFNSIQTFFGGGPESSNICAHGVEFDESGLKAEVFQILADGDTNCPNKEESGDGWLARYNPGSFGAGLSKSSPLSGEINRVNYESDQVKVTLEGDLSSVVFIPPDPAILINGNEDISSAGVIIKVGDMSGAVTINEYGQVDVDYSYEN